MNKNYLNLSFCIWGDENLNDTDISTSLQNPQYKRSILMS